MENELVREIAKWKEKRDAVILAHYYVDGAVQEIADYVGDSYYLAKIATELKEQVIIFCGVSFMGESAKLLNPNKTVIMADSSADCPMAHMIDKERIQEVRKEYSDVAVVCYVNSTAEIKAYSDICVTSSNAVKVVKAIGQKNIFFIPDNNLGRYVSKMIPEKNFIFHDGFCHVHKSIHLDRVIEAKRVNPEAKVLAHPECTKDVLDIADYIGSTSEIIAYATQSECEKFIICTEMGVFFELMRKNPKKKFYSVGHRQFCPNMKKVTLEKVLGALKEMGPEVLVDKSISKKAVIPLQKMLEFAK
ncbi:MAG: quinolinate synthase NadA [Anaerostipes sp.]|nr:quinolinate synthase NadA [Anaerostipes sp.]